MLLLLHILVALGGIGWTAYTVVTPSSTKLRITLVFLVSTVTSGFLLAWNYKTSLVTACLSGLLYSGICLSGIGLAKWRMARQILS